MHEDDRRQTTAGRKRSDGRALTRLGTRTHERLASRQRVWFSGGHPRVGALEWYVVAIVGNVVAIEPADSRDASATPEVEETSKLSRWPPAMFKKWKIETLMRWKPSSWNAKGWL